MRLGDGFPDSKGGPRPSRISGDIREAADHISEVAPNPVSTNYWAMHQATADCAAESHWVPAHGKFWPLLDLYRHCVFVQQAESV